jgi:uncharacterized protein YrzB (UPF0473 family)
MDSKGNIYRIDEDGNKEFFEVVAKANQEEIEMEEVEVRKLNRHERRKRAKLARIMASKEKVEPSKRVIRQKLKGEK